MIFFINGTVMECIFKKQIENKSDIQENLLKGTSKKCFYKVTDRNGSVFIFTKKKKILMLAYIWTLNKDYKEN